MSCNLVACVEPSQFHWQEANMMPQYYECHRIVAEQHACALPGVLIRYENFIPAMWRAVASGHVRHEHAAFVQQGLRWGFQAGFQASKMFGHRWFKNYPPAQTERGIRAIVKAISKLE